MLDRTGQRIVGVLMEKELAVPDSYPMTLNALLAGCNQKSNRDPEMSLEDFEVSGALMSLQLEEWVCKIEGSRADRYRHGVDQRLGLDGSEKAVLAELLVRGPQASRALKPRVARMGFSGSVDEVEAVLHRLRDRPQSLVELLPRAPRERDARWGHRLSEGLDHEGGAPQPASQQGLLPQPPVTASADATVPPVSQPVHRVAEVPLLEERVARLESELATLAEEVRMLRGE